MERDEIRVGGQAGIRGYLLQTMIVVLESLESPKWSAIRLEPGGEQEKADVIWFVGRRARAVQIRHSTKLITLPIARRWAREFVSGCSASEYELQIAGNVATALSRGLKLGKVRLPRPESINIERLLGAGAHALNRFFERIGITAVPAFAQGIVLRAMIAQFASYSTSGVPVKRTGFEQQLREWVVALYPNAMNEAALELQAKHNRDLEEHRLQLNLRLEGFKHDQARLSILYERRADGAARVWEKIRYAEALLNDAFKTLGFSGEPPQEERLNKALAACTELAVMWDSVAIFLPEMDDSMEALLGTVSDIKKWYVMSRQKGIGAKHEFAYYGKAKELVDTTIPELRVRVRAVISELLGFARQDAAARGMAARPSTEAPPVRSSRQTSPEPASVSEAPPVVPKEGATSA